MGSALAEGEGIWLGWFLCTTLAAFAQIADSRGEHARTAAWRQHAIGLRDSLEREGWDGGWYRRAYFDNGTVIPSASNSECRIDSIAQSWSVISGIADKTRTVFAMAAVDQYLVQPNDGLLLLLTPPFDRAQPDHGYIKGYPPGIRENGGQYTAWRTLVSDRLCYAR
jgi:cyclic beta-1,2-glucan synthetase